MDVSECKCKICEDFFVSPVCLNCTHTFCHYCLVEKIGEDWICPICQSEVTSITPNTELNRLADKLFNAQESLEFEDVTRRIKKVRQALELQNFLLGELGLNAVDKSEDDMAECERATEKLSLTTSSLPSEPLKLDQSY